MDTEVTLGDVDLSTIKTRSLSGVVTLISRSFLQRIIGTAGFFALSVFLGRPEIGLFIAVNDLVSILGYFSDIGLAASLIQKKDKVSLIDLRTTFTLQQVIVLGLLLLSLGVSPWLFSYYHIQGGGVWLFYSLLTAFFLASLKTIPSVILERQLKFEILAAVEVVESLVFYALAVLLAWQGGGVASYAWAVLLRGLVGTSLIYLLAPWPVGLAFSKSSLKSLLSFGLPYQLNSLMAVVKDRFVNIVLWKIIGADGVGVIGWAQTWSQLPLRFVMDNVTKVTFPSFARLQDHADQLKKAIEKTLFFITFLTFPIVAGLAVTAPVLIKIIPRYSKWEAALLPLALFCFNSALAAVSTPLTNTLNAIGKISLTFKLMIMWTVLAWILVPALTYLYGLNGAALGFTLVGLSSFIALYLVSKYVNINYRQSVGKPLLGTILMGLVVFIVRNLLPTSTLQLTLMLVSGCLVYTAAILILEPKIFKLIKDLLKGFKK